MANCPCARKELPLPSAPSPPPAPFPQIMCEARTGKDLCCITQAWRSDPRFDRACRPCLLALCWRCSHSDVPKQGAHWPNPYSSPTIPNPRARRPRATPQSRHDKHCTTNKLAHPPETLTVSGVRPLAGVGWGYQQAQLPAGITRHGVAPSQSARNVTRPESYNSEQPVPFGAPPCMRRGPEVQPSAGLAGDISCCLAPVAGSRSIGGTPSSTARRVLEA
jgi:hypothetical protein